LDQLQTIQAWLCGALLVGTFASAALPWWIGKLAAAGVILSCANALAGGVVMGAAFSHLLPDAQEAFEHYFDGGDEHEHDHDHDHGHDDDDIYPWAYLCAAASLLILWTIDLWMKQQGHGHSHGAMAPVEHHDHSHAHSHAQDPHAHVVHIHEPRTKKPQIVINSDQGATTDPSIAATPVDSLTQSLLRSPSGSSSSSSASASSSLSDEVDDSEAHKGHSAESAGQHDAKVRHAYVFLLALSIHSIFEGLGLGAQHTDDGLVSVIIAVVSHKCLEAFALGVGIWQAKFSRWHNLLLLVLYSMTTPVGIIIGMVSSDAEPYLISGIMTGIASGSFFYVALIEIIPSELAAPGWFKTKLCMVYLGWAIMCLVAKWA